MNGTFTISPSPPLSELRRIEADLDKREADPLLQAARASLPELVTMFDGARLNSSNVALSEGLRSHEQQLEQQQQQQEQQGQQEQQQQLTRDMEQLQQQKATLVTELTSSVVTESNSLRTATLADAELDALRLLPRGTIEMMFLASLDHCRRRYKIDNASKNKSPKQEQRGRVEEQSDDKEVEDEDEEEDAKGEQTVFEEYFGEKIGTAFASLVKTILDQRRKEHGLRDASRRPTARVIRDGYVHTIPTSAVRLGDLQIVSLRESVQADGILVWPRDQHTTQHISFSMPTLYASLTDVQRCTRHHPALMAEATNIVPAGSILTQCVVPPSVYFDLPTLRQQRRQQQDQQDQQHQQQQQRHMIPVQSVVILTVSAPSDSKHSVLIAQRAARIQQMHLPTSLKPCFSYPLFIPRHPSLEVRDRRAVLLLARCDTILVDAEGIVEFDGELEVSAVLWAGRRIGPSNNYSGSNRLPSAADLWNYNATLHEEHNNTSATAAAHDMSSSSTSSSAALSIRATVPIPPTYQITPLTMMPNDRNLRVATVSATNNIRRLLLTAMLSHLSHHRHDDQNLQQHQRQQHHAAATDLVASDPNSALPLRTVQKWLSTSSSSSWLHEYLENYAPVIAAPICVGGFSDGLPVYASMFRYVGPEYTTTTTTTTKGGGGVFSSTAAAHRNFIVVLWGSAEHVIRMCQFVADSKGQVSVTKQHVDEVAAWQHCGVPHACNLVGYAAVEITPSSIGSSVAPSPTDLASLVAASTDLCFLGSIELQSARLAHNTVALQRLSLEQGKRVVVVHSHPSPVPATCLRQRMAETLQTHHHNLQQQQQQGQGEERRCDVSNNNNGEVLLPLLHTSNKTATVQGVVAQIIALGSQRHQQHQHHPICIVAGLESAEDKVELTNLLTHGNTRGVAYVGSTHTSLPAMCHAHLSVGVCSALSKFLNTPSSSSCDVNGGGVSSNVSEVCAPLYERPHVLVKTLRMRKKNTTTMWNNAQGEEEEEEITDLMPLVDAINDAAIHIHEHS